MANYRGVKLCKAKGQYTENTTATVHTFMNRIYRSLHTISHFLLLLSFFFNIYCRCWDSDFVQLLNLVFHYGLESYTWPWRRCRLFHLKTLLMERAERFKTDSARRWSNKWTKSLYQDYLRCIANFCRALLIIFSKQFISSNTKRRKRMLNFVWNT